MSKPKPIIEMVKCANPNCDNLVKIIIGRKRKAKILFG